MYYYNGKADRQYIFLATPEQRLLGFLNGVEETSARVVKNAQNTFELSFTVYRYIDGEPSAFYENIEELMTLFVDGVWYIINEPPRVVNDGEKSEYMEIRAESAEIQLQHFDLKTFSVGMGTEESYEMQYYNKYKDMEGYEFEGSWPVVKFYNPDNPELSLLHLILYHAGLIPVDVIYDEEGNKSLDWVNNIDRGLWTIGEVDYHPKTRSNYDGTSETYWLADESYAFQVDNQDVYSFLTQDVSQAFSCIFYFDTVNKTINATYVDNIGEDTNVYIGWRNIQNSLTGTRSDQLYTAASVSGGEGVDNIGYANFGSSEIEDYSYFMNTRFVKQDLIDKYNTWTEYRDSRRTEYIEAMKGWFEADSTAKELEYRVPTDGVENDWSGMTGDELMSAYNDYSAIITALENKYVDSQGNFDVDALKASPDWDLYEQTMNYILPGIVKAIQESVDSEVVDLLYSSARTDTTWTGRLMNLSRTPIVDTMNVYYYTADGSETHSISTDSSASIYYVYDSGENAIVCYGTAEVDKLYVSYIEADAFVDVLSLYGSGNLIENATFMTTNKWDKTDAQVQLSFYSSDNLPAYGATHYVIANRYDAEDYWGLYQKNISVLPGNTYTFSVFARSYSSNDIYLWYSFEDGDYEDFTDKVVTRFQVSTNWHRVFMHIPVPSSGHTPTVTIGFFGDENMSDFEVCGPMLELGELSSPSSFGYFQQADEVLQSYKTDWKLYGTVELQNLMDNYKYQADLLADYEYDSGDTLYSDEARLHQMYLDYMQLYYEALDALTERMDELTVQEELRFEYITTANEIAADVDKNNFFDDEDLNVLQHLYKHTDYVNENIVVTYGMDTDLEVDQQWALWYDAVDNLYASSHPQYTWEDTIDNILGLEEFKNITTPLDLFSYVHVEIDDDNTFQTLRLIGVEYNPLIYQGDYKLKFSTITNYRNHRDDFSQLLGNAVKSAKNAIVGTSSNTVTTYAITPEFVKQLLSNSAFQKGAGAITGTGNNYGYGYGGGSGGNVSFDKVSANAVITKILEADEAYIEQLQAGVVTADAVTTTLLNADQAYIDSINSRIVTADTVSAAIGQFEEGDFDTLNAKYANVDFANIDVANLNITKTGEILAKVGLITDLAIEDGHVTGKLSAVEIDGNVINVNNLKADSMFLKGDDGLYYALNVNALGEATVESLGYYEVTPDTNDNPSENGWYEYDEANDEYVATEDTTVDPEKTYYGYWQDDLKEGLHGDNIIAGTITADKIYVSDLSAFEATIGGLMVDSDAIHTIGKDSVNSNVPGLYMDNQGQFNTGDATNFIASWYDSEEQKWKVAIQADVISFGDGENVRDVITGVSDKVDDMQDRMDSGEFKGEDGRDAINVVIDSSVGNIFKGGNIATILTCTVYSGWEDITSRVTAFRWMKYDKDGNLDENWTRIMTGNTIPISSSDVQSKAKFTCEVTFTT